MKYRVKEINNFFYPQFRFFFIWFNYENIYVGTIYIKKFSTYEEASEFIKNKLKKDKQKPQIKIHKLDI